MARIGKWAAAILLIAVLVTGAALAGLFAVSPPVPGPFNQATVSPVGCDGQPNGWYFVGEYGSGAYPVDPSSGNLNAPSGYGELLDSSVYWLSAQPGSSSQTIAVAGFIRSCNNANHDAMDFVRYTVYISNDGGASYHLFTNSELPSGVFTAQECGKFATSELAPFTFHIFGMDFFDETGKDISIQDGAILQVKMDFAHRTTISCPTTADDPALQWYGPMAVDEAHLRSAFPGGSFSGTRNGLNLYQVGDMFTFNWNVPSVKTDQTGTEIGANYYRMTITSDAMGNAAVGGWDNKELTSHTGQAAFLVTDAMFNPTQHTIHVAIDSALVTAFQAWTATIDNSSKAPVLISVNANKAAYQQGDTVSVAVTGKPNDITKSALVSAELHADINGQSVADATQTLFTANSDGSSTFTFTFTATFTGLLTTNAQVVDAAGRPSGFLVQKYFVGNPPPGFCQLNPDAQSCKFTGPVPLWIVLVIAGAILTLVGYLIPDNWVFIPRWIRWLVMILGVVVAFIGVWIGGFL